MVIENKEYIYCINKLSSIRNNAINTVIPFGKYKGKTIGEVFECDKQYVYWLVRESNMPIDPRTLNLKLPTAKELLALLSLTYENGKFVYEKSIYHEPIYDNWNVGHYGCSSPELVKKGWYETTYYEYTYEELLNSHKGESLYYKFPYIKWTEEYLKSLFNTVS